MKWELKVCTEINRTEHKEINCYVKGIYKYNNYSYYGVSTYRKIDVVIVLSLF